MKKKAIFLLIACISNVSALFLNGLILEDIGQRAVVNGFRCFLLSGDFSSHIRWNNIYIQLVTINNNLKGCYGNLIP